MSEKSGRPLVDYWQSVNQIMIILGVITVVLSTLIRQYAFPENHALRKIAGLSNGIYGPSLIDLAEIYSSAPNEVALMNSVRGLGTFLGSCFGGYFYERMNDQILMMSTLVVYASVTALIPVLPSLTYLYVFGFFAGASIGITSIGSQVRLVKIWAERSASAIQAFHTAFGVGAMIGPFVAAPFLSQKENGLILKETRLRIPYASFGVLFLLILTSMIAAYCVEPARIKKTEEDHKDAENSSGRTLEITLMTVLFFYLVICVNLESAFSTLISVYAVGNSSLLFSKPTAAYLAGVFWTTFTGGRVVSILVTVFFDIKQLLTISHSLVLCASGVLIVFNASASCTWTGVAMMGLGVSSMYGAASGLVLQYFHVRHIHVSVILTASCLGTASANYFVPAIVEAWPMFLMYYTGASGVLHFLVLFVMFWATKGKLTIHAKKEEVQEPSKEAVVP